MATTMVTTIVAGRNSPGTLFEINGETSSFSSIDSIVGYEDGSVEFYLDHRNMIQHQTLWQREFPPIAQQIQPVW